MSGDAFLAKVREIINEGNIRKIITKNEHDGTLVEIPLTLGVAGVVFLPVWAALGGIAALAAVLTIVGEKETDIK